MLTTGTPTEADMHDWLHAAAAAGSVAVIITILPDERLFLNVHAGYLDQIDPQLGTRVRSRIRTILDRVIKTNRRARSFSLPGPEGITRIGPLPMRVAVLLAIELSQVCGTISPARRNTDPGVTP
jgi:hypothetical protein